MRCETERFFSDRHRLRNNGNLKQEITVSHGIEIIGRRLLGKWPTWRTFFMYLFIFL